jgi:hypothetical protein
MAKEAGLEAEMEPSTRAILLNRYSEEQCRGLAPKLPTKEQKQEAAKVLNHLKAKEHMGLETKEEKKVTEGMFSKLKALNSKNQQLVGLRVDAWFKDTRTGEEIMIDTTGVHPNCESLRKAEVKRTLQNIKDGFNPAAGTKGAKIFSGRAVQEATKRKITLYTPLMGLATKQAVDGLRSKPPEFLAVACSTLGN